MTIIESHQVLIGALGPDMTETDKVLKKMLNTPPGESITPDRPTMSDLQNRAQPSRLRRMADTNT